jgi:hypothetical protein
MIDFNNLTPEQNALMEKIASQADHDALVDEGIEEPQAFINKQANYDADWVKFYDQRRADSRVEVRKLKVASARAEVFAENVYTQNFNEILPYAIAEWEAKQDAINNRA